MKTDQLLIVIAAIGLIFLTGHIQSRLDICKRQQQKRSAVYYKFSFAMLLKNYPKTSIAIDEFQVIGALPILRKGFRVVIK